MATMMPPHTQQLADQMLDHASETFKMNFTSAFNGKVPHNVAIINTVYRPMTKGKNLLFFPDVKRFYSFKFSVDVDPGDIAINPLMLCGSYLCGTHKGYFVKFNKKVTGILFKIFDHGNNEKDVDEISLFNPAELEEMIRIKHAGTYVNTGDALFLNMTSHTGKKSFLKLRVANDYVSGFVAKSTRMKFITDEENIGVM